MNNYQKPLWRKKSKEIRVSDVHSKYDKHTKSGVKKSMSSRNNGRDFTPLYKFLLSSIGKDFDDVYKECKARLDVSDSDRIWDIIGQHKDPSFLTTTCRVGESSYYSTLYVDNENILRMAYPEVTNEKLYPSCSCCTHTFNGKPFINKFKK